MALGSNLRKGTKDEPKSEAPKAKRTSKKKKVICKATETATRTKTKKKTSTPKSKIGAYITHQQDTRRRELREKYNLELERLSQIHYKNE